MNTFWYIVFFFSWLCCAITLAFYFLEVNWSKMGSMMKRKWFYCHYCCCCSVTMSKLKQKVFWHKMTQKRKINSGDFMSVESSCCCQGQTTHYLHIQIWNLKNIIWNPKNNNKYWHYFTVFSKEFYEPGTPDLCVTCQWKPCIACLRVK